MFDVDSPLQIFDSTMLASEPRVPTPWLWEGYLARGMITLMTSRWKTGKTTLLSVLLARLGGGGRLAEAAVTPGQVMFFTEEPPQLWQERHARLNFGRNVKWSSRPFKRRPTPREWYLLVQSLVPIP